MDHPLFALIEQKILAAEEAGEFENLTGAGHPLPLDGDPENALINRLVKESGAVPEFVTLSKELRRLREELAETGDRTRRRDIMKEMSMMEARIEIARKPPLDAIPVNQPGTIAQKALTMCGFFATTLPVDAMAQLFQASPANDLPARENFNVCPTTQVSVISLLGGGVCLRCAGASCLHGIRQKTMGRC